MLPDGTSVGIPGLAPDAPTVGRAALGLTVQPPLDGGQVGVDRLMSDTYAEDDVPDGVIVAH